jgi:hypothetical protein
MPSLHFTGTGCGFAMTPTLTIVNFYFEKKRGLANGILWSASGISNSLLTNANDIAVQYIKKVGLFINERYV